MGSEMCIRDSPPPAPCEPANLRIPLVRYLLPCLLPSGDLTITLPFSCFVFSISIGRRLVSPCLKLPPRFLLRLVQRGICIWYVRTLIPLFFIYSGTRFVLIIVCIMFCFIFFYPEVIFHSEDIGPVTDCIILWR